MIRIDITEDDTKWIGTVRGYEDGKITDQCKLEVLTRVYGISLTKKVPLKALLTQMQTDAKKALNSTPKVTAQLPVIMSYTFPKPGRAPTVKRTEDPHAIKPATDQFLADKYPNSFRHFTASSLQEFETEFLKNVQGLIIDTVNNYGRLLNPNAV